MVSRTAFMPLFNGFFSDCFRQVLSTVRVHHLESSYKYSSHEIVFCATLLIMNIKILQASAIQFNLELGI
uniref:Ovule protein n=1 Tax=Steinernema glaseri TaxID=37863 RepID=A0A1I8AP28_9BILA